MNGIVLVVCVSKSNSLFFCSLGPKLTEVAIVPQSWDSLLHKVSLNRFIWHRQRVLVVVLDSFVSFCAWILTWLLVLIGCLRYHMGVV